MGRCLSTYFIVFLSFYASLCSVNVRGTKDSVYIARCPKLNYHSVYKFISSFGVSYCVLSVGEIQFKI